MKLKDKVAIVTGARDIGRPVSVKLAAEGAKVVVNYFSSDAAKEAADSVCYLASDESSFLTGTNIDINGGTFFPRQDNLQV